MQTLETSRPVVGAISVGIAQAALENAIHYAHQRKQFGQKIASFEMVQEMIANMVTKTEAARALVYKACWLKMQGDKRASMFSAMSKCFASDTAMEVTTTAVQVMGGNGYSREIRMKNTCVMPRSCRSMKERIRYSASSLLMKLYIDHWIKRVRESRRLSRTRFCMTEKGGCLYFLDPQNLPNDL